MGVSRRVGGQITNEVGERIVFSDFKTAWRKEREHDFPRWKLGFEGFQNRSALLKFAERRTMNPTNLMIFERAEIEFFAPIFAAFEPFLSFFVEKGCEPSRGDEAEKEERVDFF